MRDSSLVRTCTKAVLCCLTIMASTAVTLLMHAYMAARCLPYLGHVSAPFKLQEPPSRRSGNVNRCIVATMVIVCLLCSIQMLAQRLSVGEYTAQQGLEAFQWNTNSALGMLADSTTGMKP